MKYDTYIGRGFHRWNKPYIKNQLRAFNDLDNSFVLFSGAYRSGKTELGARRKIKHAYFLPFSKVGIFRQHLASIKKTTLLTVLELIHPTWIKNWSNADLVLELKNGSTISFIGADFPDRLGSIELTAAFIDEASELSEESLGMIQGRLSGELKRPSNYDDLPDDIKTYIDKSIKIRQVTLACNPKSPRHFLYRDFIDSPKPGHICYTSNTIANTHLPEIYIVNNLSAYTRPGVDRDWIIDQLRKIRSGEKSSDGLHLIDYLTPFGQRNLLGMWTSVSGAIYDLDEALHCIDEISSDLGNHVATYLSCDFGFHHPRIGVYRNYKVNGEDVYVFVEGWSEKEVEDDVLVKNLKRLKDKYNARYAYMPSDRPGVIKLAKRTCGQSFVKRAKMEVLSGINTTSRFLNQRRLLFLKTATDYDLCWGEFTSYCWKQDRDGDHIDQPIKQDDHYPDSARYLLHTRHYKDPA